ncbi:MAG: hypothetical protein HQL73_13930, partial [Magnetococcales bacterium]|nr:hypothetical protein [Magnetococcales bacterium]
MKHTLVFTGRTRVLFLAGLMSLACTHAQAAPPAANQLPGGGQVVSGQGSINQAGANMTINQATQSMITNWKSFDIGK